MSRDRYEELERAAVLDEEAGDQAPGPAGTEKGTPKPLRQRAKRLPRLPGGWVRVPLSWLAPDGVFRPRERLFLLLLYRSHWGQRPVRVTAALVAEIGISSDRTRRRVLQELAELNAVRIEQQGRQAPMVWPRIVIVSDGS